ncbi:hypothetical protein M422DRAFT_262500 [Sphaerobolus stellatus SS14]|uniref:Uncharacterized protein n=1 Tax=Sphaerobolus stellatus (strain SS14) TaxID=990650 RepID=A0A0C9V138_SPHS4|nr:hypothetical protein M422DRAFT_262500 [Sphaerobolus stellatus SS14]
MATNKVVNEDCRLIFMHANNVFTSPNQTFLPLLPTHKTLVYWENAGSKGFQDRQWFVARHPQLALIPEYPIYDGPILQRLWIDNPSVWLVNIGGLWKMEKDVADSWCRLELALACIAKKLIKHSGVT